MHSDAWLIGFDRVLCSLLVCRPSCIAALFKSSQLVFLFVGASPEHAIYKMILEINIPDKCSQVAKVVQVKRNP